MGPAVQIRAHTLLTQTRSHAFPWHLRRGSVGAWAWALFTPGSCCPILGCRGPHCLNSHLGSPLSTHALARARAHTSDIPIVPHVTHGPERAHPSHTLTHACTHKHTRPPGHFPTPSDPPPPTARSPAKALIDCDTPTLIHRHTHSPHTCQPQTHIHKQGQEKYTRTPSPTLSGALSHSCPLSGLPISLCAGTQARLQNSLSALSTCAGPSPRAPFPTVYPQTLSR